MITDCITPFRGYQASGSDVRLQQLNLKNPGFKIPSEFHAQDNARIPGHYAQHEKPC